MAEIITKAELARELKVSPPRVAQYVKSGMPVRSDGRLNRHEVLSWFAKYRTSGRDRSKGPALAAALLHQAPLAASSEERREPELLGFYPGFDRRWGELDKARVETLERIILDWQEPLARIVLEAGIPIERAACLLEMIGLEILGLGNKALATLGVPGFKSLDAFLGMGISSPLDWHGLADEIGTTFDPKAFDKVKAGLPYYRDRSVFDSDA